MTEHIEDNTNQCKALAKDTPGVVKPCVLSLITAGVGDCRREVGLAIVLEMKRLDVKRPTIAGILTAWNLRNDPPLFRPELNSLIDVAYADQEYEFDCELLSKLVPGVCENRHGKRNCIYIDLLLELEIRDMKRPGKQRKRAKRQKSRGQKKKAKGQKAKGTASKQRVLFPDSW